MENITFCQSCGMPLTNPEEISTEKDGSKCTDYCCYCYENGAFKSNETMEQMLEACVHFMTEDGMTENDARALLNEQLPKLKRWAKA